jgi:hypothetical protein
MITYQKIDDAKLKEAEVKHNSRLKESEHASNEIKNKGVKIET